MQADIAVLGGGFSASAMIVNLIGTLDPSQTIAVVGERTDFGLGVAYGTRLSQHRLNVPAARMGMRADRPSDLVDWLEAMGFPHGPEDFIPRSLYGAYVQSRLADAIRRSDNGPRLVMVGGRAVGLELAGDGRQHYRLSDGSRIDVGRSVLCLGSTPARLPLDPDRRNLDPAFIIEDPWSDWSGTVDPDAAILIVGTGLTMIDQVLALRAGGHTGPIDAISRRGLVPLSHVVPRREPPAPALGPGAGPLSDMLRQLRQRAQESGDWRGVVDSLRPVTQAIWADWDSETRRRFLRHGAAPWNIHRHRVAPDIAANIEDLRASGVLRIHAGHLEALDMVKGRARLAYRTRNRGDLRHIKADLVVNCTGLDRCALGRSELLADMNRKGYATEDPLGLGIAVTAASEIIDRNGAGHPGLYAIGPMTVGRFFEIIAVPDIREQVRAVGERLRDAA